ncbi:hypothetical protein [Winogradskyella sp.]|uniref:hypothetical protein n=1 Tax=Winogradskyella sp. TaxID=1883156 RepID=UPI003BADB7BC
MGKFEEGQLSLDYDVPRNDNFLRHNTFMFIEDLSISKYSIKDEYLSISLETNLEEEITNFLANNVTTFRFRNNYWSRRSNFNDELLELIETISNQLINKGFCVFEKVYEREKLVRLKVVMGEYKIKRNNIIQIIPDDVAAKIKSNTKVFIPKEKCFVLEFPKRLCSSKEYLNILKKMVEIDGKDPMLSILNPSNLSKVSGYDAMKHRYKLDLTLRQLTKKLSWHHREQFSSRDKFSDYYSTLRSLKFRRTKIILLNHIFDFIELIIEEIFDKTTLDISYNKTLEDIDKIIKDYEKGIFTNDLHLKIIKEFM